jgi:chorismate lyase/3-hydroxybenzoate synthase
LQRLGYRHWLRAWNVLSSINDGPCDRERYRRFVVGRHRAFARTPGFEHSLPAATALGARDEPGLTIAFLASRVPGIQVENPRQVSAFAYPRIYGPASPSFSRAILQHWRDRSLLYLSGTGSIVGHATVHVGDADGQFEEILRNIEALLEHAAKEHCGGQSPDSFRPVAPKLYVRDAEVWRAIERRWQSSALGGSRPLVLVADLCRRDLLLEVEAVFEWQRR